MLSKPKTKRIRSKQASRNPRPKTGNRKRKTGCRLCGERESVSVHEKDIRFVEPAGPAPPFEPPRPQFRRKSKTHDVRLRDIRPETGNRMRPLDPRASRGVPGVRGSVSRVQGLVSRVRPPVSRAPERRGLPGPLDPKASRTRDPKPETVNRRPDTAMSREDFLRTGTGLGGALFAAALAFGKKKKKGERHQ